MEEYTTIRLPKKIVEELKSLGTKGETYEDIIKRLMEKWKKNS